MRVLLITQELPPETGWGGIGTYVATLGPALAALGAEVHVLSVVPGQATSDRHQNGMEVHRRPLLRPRGVARATRLPETWDRLSLPVAVDREVRRLDLQPDVIEIPDWRAEGLVLAFRNTVPTVIRLHSAASQLFPFSNRAGLDARLASRLEHRAMSAADIVVSTRSNLDALDSTLRRRLVATRAVSLPVAQTASPELSPSAPSEPRVLFTGRLERRKGPEIIVEAARLVLDRLPQTRFQFAGADTGRAPGSYLALLRARAQALGVEHALEFSGHLDEALLTEAMARARLCVFPSRQETFGYGAAEAAALARPVVASAIAPYNELFANGNAARLVPTTDVAGWGAAMIELLTNAEKAGALGREGRRAVIEQCAPENIARAMLTVYDEARSKSSLHRA